MKKKKSLNQKVIFGLVIIFLVVILLFGCKKIYITYKQNQEKKAIDTRMDELASSRVRKASYLEKSDGWYYFMTNDIVGDIQYPYLDGCNIKYATLSDNYRIDTNLSESSKNSKVLVTPPSLSTSYKTKDGQKFEGEELNEINDFFTTNSWKREIKANDLSSLKLINFNVNDIVKLWNEMYKSAGLSSFGSYSSYNECMIEKNTLDDDHFQVGVIFNYGNIEIVRIDYVYKNGKHLTDIVDNGQPTKLQIEIYNNIKMIEKEILNDKNFYLNNKFTELREDDFYKDLFKIFEKIEENKNK